MASKPRSARDNLEMFQFKVTLRGVRPAIWRRFQVPGDYTLARLHRVLQIVMGWWDSHLHEFQMGGNRWGHEDEYTDGDLSDERRVAILDLKLKPKARLLYTYDFGDDWQHELLLEKIVRAKERPRHAVCLGGKRAGPPEDCGGPWGYTRLLEALADPRDQDHADLKEWAGEIDPEAFDPETINAALRRLR